jgi:hypothetical protein
VSRISDPHPESQGDRPTSRRRTASVPANNQAWFWLNLRILIIGILILASAAATRAQEERGTRLPVVGKIGGKSHQAFNGKVQDVDMKRNLLKVNTVEGSATEFFPIKKNVPVSKANGEKLKVQDLVPGNNIIIYYDQREDRRTVTQIIVLSSGGEGKEGKAEKEKKQSPPPS